MTTPERWTPDAQLIPAVLAGAGSSRSAADLSPADRAWVVAGLTLAGLTAEDIADRLNCSLRLVRAVRAEPMTAVCLLYRSEAEHFADELRLLRSELSDTRRDLADSEAENARLRGQLDRLLARIITGVPQCSKGHAMTPYNTYIHTVTGTRQCRACHRERQQSYRDRARSAAT